MDEFEVFFTFYGLILGLAVAEILNALGGMARDGALRAMRPQATLLAFLTFLLICATWIDAYTVRADFSLGLRSLWAPIGAATAYYLAAVVVLPRGASCGDDMDAYFRERKRFIVACLVAAELFVKAMFIPHFAGQYRTAPMVFWLYSVPLNAAIFITFAMMFHAKSRRANIAAIATQIVIFTIPYWSYRMVTTSISKIYGYASS